MVRRRDWQGHDKFLGVADHEQVGTFPIEDFMVQFGTLPTERDLAVQKWGTREHSEHGNAPNQTIVGEFCWVVFGTTHV